MTEYKEPLRFDQLCEMLEMPLSAIVDLLNSHNHRAHKDWQFHNGHFCCGKQDPCYGAEIVYDNYTALEKALLYREEDRIQARIDRTAEDLIK